MTDTTIAAATENATAGATRLKTSTDRHRGSDNSLIAGPYRHFLASVREYAR
jgi:hypothetical protein